MKGARIAGIALLLLVAGPGGWFVTDALEQDNDFCNLCHLEPGVPLHIDIRRDFDARPDASLAAVHGAATVAAREGGTPEEAAFRCIDCHGGVSFVGRARVKVLAAKDAFWWVVGHFDEPTGMAWPLWDEDCSQCHASFSESAESAGSEGAGAGGAQPPFHALPVHNAELGVGCVECHLSHESGGLADLYHLQPAHVRQQCARCHTEFEEGT